MSIRTEKVAGLIKVEMGYIIEKYLRNDISAFLTVTHVSISPDLKNAKIFISIFNKEGDKEEIINNMLSIKNNHINQALVLILPILFNNIELYVKYLFLKKYA